MIAFISSKIDALLGRGDAAVTVPLMDGALQPNNALEAFDVTLDVDAPDNLVEAAGRVYFTSGAKLLELRDGSSVAIDTFEAEISALTAFADGRLVVGLAHGELRISDASGWRTIKQLGRYTCHCPTALLASDLHTIVVAEGSTQNRAAQWKHDLMKHGATGSVWRLDLEAQTAELLASGLAFPYGLARGDGDQVLVSESWKHRILALGNGKPAVVLDNLPGYPARLSPALGGGFWLSVFAPRSQLVEFVLREARYRQRMLTEIDEAYWVAPALASGKHFKEPLQGGAIKSMGILKPWAPTRSYGLLVRLNAALQPESSFHSRADGHRHGITSAVETSLGLTASSKGGNMIIAKRSRVS